MASKFARKSLLVAIAASFCLSACGIKGQLKTPPPVWGEDAPKPTDTDSSQT